MFICSKHLLDLRLALLLPGVKLTRVPRTI